MACFLSVRSMGMVLAGSVALAAVAGTQAAVPLFAPQALTAVALAKAADKDKAKPSKKRDASPVDASKYGVGLIELEGAIADRATSGGLFGGGTVTLRDVLAEIRGSADRNDIQALVIRLKDAQLRSSQIHELGSAMQAARGAGKKIHVFSENYGPSELLLGAYADEVIIQSGGGVSLPGMTIDEMYLSDMFNWAGIKADFVQIGDYKGASEMYANAKPSKAWDENINGLLDSMYGTMREQIKAGRKMDDAKLDKAMEICWMASGEEAKAAGLIDTIIDLPELDAHLGKLAGAGKEVTWTEEFSTDPKKNGPDMASMNPFTMFSKLMAKPDHQPKRDTIAVLHVDGAIIDGESTSGGLLGGGASVGSRTLRRALSEIEENDKIKGLIIRIDSPGGSAIASEVIWQGVKRVAENKPVWASIGDMAASGGYYIAVSSDKIYVNRSSIVGSIGVVGGKFALGGVLEKLHINTVTRTRGPRAAMVSMSTPWTDADKLLVRQKMQDTYGLFTKRVTAGRKGIELAKTAEGRLFVGQKAVDLKMADAVGTLEDSLGDMAKSLDLASGSYDVMDYPAAKGFDEMLEGLMGGFGLGAKTQTAAFNPSGPMALQAIGGQIGLVGKELFGARGWQSISSQIEAAWQLHKEPVLLTAPQVIIIR